MGTKQGGLELLKDPVAQEMLKSTVPARLAYTWSDGSPRVVPIWFHWNGSEVVLASPADAPKVKVLAKNPKVALTIDDNTWPHKVLLIRGTAQVQIVDGVPEEYAAAARRYFGEEQGNAWVAQAGQLAPKQARIVVKPTWVGILDFQQRFPSALEAAMGGG